MSQQHNDPRKLLTAEAKRLLGLYRKANKDRPGPEPKFDNFLIEAGANLGIEASGLDPKTRHEVWKRSAGYRRMKYRQMLGGDYIPRVVEGDFADIGFFVHLNPRRDGWRSSITSDCPFMKAVSAVMVALENGPGGRPPKPMPSDRELMRIFRPPGKKNCSAKDLARFRPAIVGLARELTK